MCNKVGYPTKSDAKKDAVIQIKVSQAKKAMKKDAKKFRPYLCPYCGEYHLTTQKKRKY